MRAPLAGTLTETNPFGTVGYGVFGKHAGVDLRASVGTKLLAPAAGKVVERYIGHKGLKVLALRIGDYDHRFLHLNDFSVKLGDAVKAGQVIGHTGNTGNVAAHLHWDVRRKGTAWNGSFSDYVDPMKLIGEEDELYKGQTAKYYHDKLVKTQKELERYKGYTQTWRLRYEGVMNWLKGKLGIK